MIGRERWRFGTHPSRRAAGASPLACACTWPALAGLLATLLASLVDFVPDPVLVIASSILALLSAWMIYGRLAKPLGKEQSRAKPSYVGMCLFFAGAWSTLAVLLPALPTWLSGTMTVERHAVLSRSAPWQQGVCSALKIEGLGWPWARAFCVGNAVWQTSEPGQMMAIRLSRSALGAYVHEMEPVCGDMAVAPASGIQQRND